MDDLGKRIVGDQAAITALRKAADDHERKARDLREEAGEMERLLDLARLQYT